MTDDNRHAEIIALLTEIRDAVRALAPVAPPIPNPFADLMALPQRLAALSRLRTAPAQNSEWSGEITFRDDGWAEAAGVLWRWQSTLHKVSGPYCPGVACRHVTSGALSFQASSGPETTEANDIAILGPLGWLICERCRATYAVPGHVTIGAIRAAVDTACRGRRGLAGRER